MLTPDTVHDLQTTKAQSAQIASPVDCKSDNFDASSVALKFARNAEIFAEGDAVGYAYKVVSGVVRVAKLLPDGRRQISAFHLQGDVFGFEIDNVHHMSAEAVGPVKLLAFRWRNLLGSADSSGFARELLNRTMIGLRQTQDHLLLLGRKSALERLASFLLEIARRSGSGRAIRLDMPRHDIGDYLGLTLETVSRMFAELRNMKVIELESARRVSVIDMPRLQALAT